MKGGQFTTLPEAIDWARAHWTVKELPLKLHSGGVEPQSQLGAPRAAAQFLAYLMASPDDHSILAEQSTCRHPQLAQTWDAETAQPVYQESVMRCPDCQGSGTSYKSGIRWRFPMWRALRGVRSVVAKPGQPTPIILIAALVLNAWEPDHAAAYLSLEPAAARPLFLDALNVLHSRYEAGPIPDGRRRADQQDVAVA